MEVNKYAHLWLDERTRKISKNYEQFAKKNKQLNPFKSLAII